MNETVVIVRCQQCMHERKRQDVTSNNIVFIASTLQKYVEEKCEQCGNIGMEIYVGEPPSQPTLADQY